MASAAFHFMLHRRLTFEVSVILRNFDSIIFVSVALPFLAADARRSGHETNKGLVMYNQRPLICIAWSKFRFRTYDPCVALTN
ncbi:hypothetical protein DY000_02033698 [Brassica cretica]|uniref:Secreted protein n=1 Tax=Brassica cretica TaxID=69181 RepID=A0ABQ7DJP6_BRACR|nr:hypothetical protein DY000_02033698 [Brassica cretica]